MLPEKCIVGYYNSIVVWTLPMPSTVVKLPSYKLSVAPQGAINTSVVVQNCTPLQLKIKVIFFIRRL